VAWQRVYYERGQPIEVITWWGARRGTRNVLIERGDGTQVVRPFSQLVPRDLPVPAVAAAVAELLHVLLIVAGVIVGAGAAGLAGLLAWRLRRTRVDAARTMPPLPSKMVRAAQPLPQARRAGELPAAPQREPPGGLYLHFHGVSAEDVAAILCNQDRP
jgi:hypothetical protein